MRGLLVVFVLPAGNQFKTSTNQYHNLSGTLASAVSGKQVKPP